MSLFAGGIQGSTSGRRRSRFCTDTTCLEVAVSGTILITDSKQSDDRVILEVDAEIWNEFCYRVGSTEGGITVDGLSVSLDNDGFGYSY